MKLFYPFFLISFFAISIVFAQHDNHKMGKDSSNMGNATHDMEEMDMDSSSSSPAMHSALSINLPMNRNGSGTTWHPDNSPMYMSMFHSKRWMFMLHYGVFANYTIQNFNNPSKRGGNMFYSNNWAMLMANRTIGKKGLFMIRGMFSADPLTTGGYGYPLLLQTGETWKDQPLLDRQHPHDLISELSIGYSQAFSKNIDVYGYLGIPGEPTIGPPAFMHRPSALNMPTSPISHHWQDATHITFGVATVGVRYKNVKLDGSIFTGREPNENRYNFDQMRFDSYSARLSVNPHKSLALQASYGYIKSPETHAPDENINRFSASALHNIYLGKRILSSSFIWGMNSKKSIAEDNREHSNSFLLESALQGEKMNYFTRLETVQKSNDELLIASGDKHFVNTIYAINLGASVYLYKSKYIWMDLGAMTTLNLFNQEIETYYGKNPMSIMGFLRLVPPRMGKMKM
ncbi:MAG: hypothetical protein H7282_15360 [Cytophagaceae bacterium]|nr:hypothetical protein [Cytophagaceae bacterium]